LRAIAFTADVATTT